MGNSSAVHELDEDLRAFGMHRFGDTFPPLDLGRGEDSRYAWVPQPIGRGRRALGDNQSRRTALRVVRFHQGVGNIVGRAVARHRRHDQMVLQWQRAENGF